MDLSQALATAAEVMLLGMVCVFSFLGLLIIAIKVVAKFCPEETPVTSIKAGTATQSGTSSQVSPNVIAAISAAVHQYRNSRGKPQDK